MAEMAMERPAQVGPAVVSPTLLGLSVKSMVVHSVTYFLVGLVASTVFNYGAQFESGALAGMMRPIDDPLVMAGPLFQPLRGLIFALALYPLSGAIFNRKWGWAILWWLLVAVGILSTYGPSPSSVEGLIYLKISPAAQIGGGTLEVLSQSLLYALLLVYWVEHPKAVWLNWVMGVVFVVMMALPVLGLLALSAGLV